VLPGPEFLKQVRALCDEAGLLLIFDEIRPAWVVPELARAFAYEHFGVTTPTS